MCDCTYESERALALRESFCYLQLKHAGPWTRSLVYGRRLFQPYIVMFGIIMGCTRGGGTCQANANNLHLGVQDDFRISATAGFKGTKAGGERLLPGVVHKSSL